MLVRVIGLLTRSIKVFSAHTWQDLSLDNNFLQTLYYHKEVGNMSLRGMLLDSRKIRSVRDKVLGYEVRLKVLNINRLAN